MSYAIEHSTADLIRGRLLHVGVVGSQAVTACLCSVTSRGHRHLKGGLTVLAALHFSANLVACMR